jgi:DNA-binding NarL/FixJ family response regulator
VLSSGGRELPSRAQGRRLVCRLTAAARAGIRVAGRTPGHDEEGSHQRGGRHRRDELAGVRLIRAVVVDDHPAMRTGMRAVLDAAPDIEACGEASSSADLWPVMTRVDPDVVLMDWHLPGDDGLVLCHRLKRRNPRTRVVLFSAYADDWLVVPALLAQADALLAKRAPAALLYEAIRAVMDRDGPPDVVLRPDQREALNAMLDPADVGIAGLLLLGTPPHEVASRCGLSSTTLGERVEAILARLAAAHGPGVTYGDRP